MSDDSKEMTPDRAAALDEVRALLEKHAALLGPSNDGSVNDPEGDEPVGQCILNGFVLLTSWTDLESPSDPIDGLPDTYSVRARWHCRVTEAIGMLVSATHDWCEA